MPLCAVDGMAVTTVEGIGSTKTVLHPVQVKTGLASVASLAGLSVNNSKIQNNFWWDQNMPKNDHNLKGTKKINLFSFRSFSWVSGFHVVSSEHYS